MFVIFKYAYQLWHTLTKEDIIKQRKLNHITDEQYKEITGEDYMGS